MVGFGPLGSAPLGAFPLSIQPIDSSRWTGLLTQTQITEARRDKLQGLVDQAVRDLDLLGAGNAEKAQATAYLVALKVLSEAPEPPTDIVWKLLERGMALVCVCELFYKIAEALAQ